MPLRRTVPLASPATSVRASGSVRTLVTCKVSLLHWDAARISLGSRMQLGETGPVKLVPVKRSPWSGLVGPDNRALWDRSRCDWDARARHSKICIDEMGGASVATISWSSPSTRPPTTRTRPSASRGCRRRPAGRPGSVLDLCRWPGRRCRTSCHPERGSTNPSGRSGRRRGASPFPPTWGTVVRSVKVPVGVKGHQQGRWQYGSVHRMLPLRWPMGAKRARRKAARGG